MKSKLKDLLRVAFGTCPLGMVNLLSKLEPRAETAEFYRAVHMALSREDVLSRTLQHSQTINPRMVVWIACLPNDRVTVRMASYALRRNGSDFDLEEMSWLGRQVVYFDKTGQILDQICRSSNPLISLRKAIANLPFPEAPWKMRDLIPIKSADELSQVARKMENCLKDHDQFYSSCIDVQMGISYYYRTAEVDCLLLKFSKFGGIGWYLDERRGLQNRRPTVEEADSLTKLLSHLDGIWCRRLSYHMR